MEEVLQELQDAMQRYHFVEQELVKRKHRLLVKEPEIQKCLDAVMLLLKQRDNGSEEVNHLVENMSPNVSLWYLESMVFLSQTFRV